MREMVDPVQTTSLACVLTVCPGLFVQITWVSVLYTKLIVSQMEELQPRKLLI